MARKADYKTVFVEAHEEKRLGPLIAPHMRSLLFDLNRIAGVGEKVKRGLRVLRSFIGSLKLTMNDMTMGLDIDPEKGAADSGDLEVDLPSLFVAVGEAAEERKSAAALLIDEIQYFESKELGALIMAMHKVQQRQLPLVLLGAGLPILPGLAGESKSYAERLFNFPDVGALIEEDAAKALKEPQEWGYQVWNAAKASPIGLAIVKAATERVVPRLDQNFFRVRFDRLTPSEKNFLRAMAELGPGPHRTGDIADVLGVKVTSVGPVRAKLIRKGMVYSPAPGDMAFTVPLFDEFMVRAIPKLHRRA